MNETTGYKNLFANIDNTPLSLSYQLVIAVLLFIVGLSGCNDEQASRGAGQKTQIIPNVVGQNESRAADTLVEMGFNVKTDYKHHEAPISEVIDQMPKPGSSVKAGGEIQLTVSNGIPVPKLIGMTETRAEDMLLDKGLNFEPRYVDSKEKIGQVIDQSIKDGELVRTGTSVVLTLSNGVAVPDVVGKNKDEALQTLEERGLNHKLSRITSFQPIGQIIDQEIEPTTRVDAGTHIPLTVSRGISVPDVVGMSEANALKALADAGLSYELNYVDSKKASGEVVEQDIDAGKHVNSGTLVRLSISGSEDA